MTYIFLILLIVFDLHKFEVAKNDTEVAILLFNLSKTEARTKAEEQILDENQTESGLQFLQL